MKILLMLAQITGLPCGYQWQVMADIPAEARIEATASGYKILDADPGYYCYVIVLTKAGADPVLSNVTCNQANRYGSVITVEIGNADGWTPRVFRTDGGTPDAPQDLIITCLHEQLPVLLAGLQP